MSILPVLLIALAAVILEYMLPGAQNSKNAGAFRMVSGLCILAALIVPLKEGISLLSGLASGDSTLIEKLEGNESNWTFPDPEEYQNMLNSQLVHTSEKEVETWVIQSLESQFGIIPDSCQVKADVSSNSLVHQDTASNEQSVKFSLERVWITLHGQSVLRNPHTIESWFSERLGCPCTVEVGS